MSSGKSSGGCLKYLFYLIVLLVVIAYIGNKIETLTDDDVYLPDDYTESWYSTDGQDDYPSVTTSRQPIITSAPETASPQLQNIPSDIRSHVFLKAKGGGYCEEFKGKAELNVIFVTDNISKWSSSSEGSAKSDIESEMSRIMSTAKNAGVSLELTVRYYRADLSGQNISGAGFEGEWRDSATNAAGLGEYKSAQSRIESSHGVSSAPIVFLFDQSGRAIAQNSYGKGSGAESILLFSDDINALFHEMCHIYGAKDFYYPSDVKSLAEKYLSGSIMINSNDGAIDPLTAFIIGWTDTLSSSAENFLRDTSYLTEEYLKEENEKETITGYGTREYSGGTYTGNMIKGWPNGEGTLKKSDGSYYSGTWNNGDFLHGECVIYYTDGAIFRGTYKNGNRSGYGEMTYSNGVVYKGNFSDGERNGQGTAYYTDGAVYSGNWQNGERSGYGELKYSNGVVYKGNFSDGTLNGQGTMYYTDGAVYSGNWQDGKRNGYGELKYSSGSVYKGNFSDGTLNGQGTMYYSDGGVYSGGWQDGERSGYGETKFANGTVYKGNYANGSANGQGTMYYVGGDVYQGNWKDGKRHGYGVYTWASGSQRSGNWENGEFVG